MSSVPKYKRTTSKIHFLATFNKIRKETIMILMRDFGIKARSYSIDLMEIIYEMSEDDSKEFEDLCEKYNITSFDIDKYPEWLVNGWRNELMMILNNLGIEIQCANSIYVTNIQEYYNRRNHWNTAIGYCMALMDKLHEIIACIHVKIGAYEHVFEMIIEEIKLLKAVRKSDNRYLKKFNDYLPYYDNGYIYNNYPSMPFVPNYCINNNSITATRQTVMCNIVDNSMPYDVYRANSIVISG